MLLPQQLSPPFFHALFSSILSKRLEFVQDAPTTTGITTTFSLPLFADISQFSRFLLRILYPAISEGCRINNDDNLTPSVSSLFFFYVWSFDPRLISKPNYYMLAGVFPWGCIILNIPGSL